MSGLGCSGKEGLRSDQGCFMGELVFELDVKFYCQRCGKDTLHRENSLNEC